MTSALVQQDQTHHRAAAMPWREMCDQLAAS